ncbi:c-type cytochrome [Undibacterium sp. RuRC25W]|uniref:c-type cytochrome n=1 Tax=Undibacterium sp. RuRC25W TaxID=3413047 RepID=UPI003BF309FC
MLNFWGALFVIRRLTGDVPASLCGFHFIDESEMSPENDWFSMRNLLGFVLTLIPLLHLQGVLAAPATVTTVRSGATVFNLMCAECHVTGISGAPKISDKSAWTLRLKQPPDTLIEHALHGYKQMPARGSCSSCSDAEIKAAVAYMIERTK